MIGNMENENGNITIDTEVITSCAGHAALDCFGIVGMATVSIRDGLAKVLRKESISQGIQVEISEDNEIIIDFHIIVAYGVSIKTVVNNLIENVKYQVQEATSMKVKKINVYVEGVRVID